jgi:tetratricopeptide (TPR) repeat protein
MVGTGDSETAKVLLEAVENILSNVKYDKESQSLLATVCCNLSFIYCQEKEIDLAIDALDRAYKIDRKNKDLVGCVTIKLNRCTLLNSIGNYKEALTNINESVQLLEAKVNDMMVDKVDSELTKNARFIDRMHLLCA